MTEKKTGKASIYFKDTELRRDIELLAEYDGLSLTALVNSVLKDYVASRPEHIEFMRKREQELIERRQHGVNEL